MLLALALLSFAAEWEVTRDDGTTRIERRPRADGFVELRASTTTNVSPAALADTFWTRTPGVKAVKKYVVVSATESEKIVYEQLKLPVAKDRDYTVRIVRYADVEHGLYQFTSHCDSAAGPPPNDEHVRVTRCETEITFERAADGHTYFTYVTFADTAGRLPKWIVNLLAPRAAGQFMEQLIAEARAATSIDSSRPRPRRIAHSPPPSQPPRDAKHSVTHSRASVST